MATPDAIQLLQPDWPCPARVRAVISTRQGGRSRGPFSGANLGDHVGDDPLAVAANRAALAHQTGVRHWPWLQQVHGTDVVALTAGAAAPGCVADGAYTRASGVACAVLTADCLPVLLCDRHGSQVAAVHAGWRGLAAGILGRAVARFETPAADLLAFLGPAIGPRHFEVGRDVLEAYDQLFFHLGYDGDWRGCFNPVLGKAGHFLADLYALARLALQCAGVQQLYGGTDCTYGDTGRFYSFRRDRVTGRMVSAIWLADD